MEKEKEAISKTNNENIFNNSNDFKDFVKDGFKIFMEAIRNSNALPIDKEYEIQSTQESYVEFVNNQGESILKMMNEILCNYGIKSSIKSNYLRDKSELLVEANDTILERVANVLDEINGLKAKNVEPVDLQIVSANASINGSWNRISSVNKAALLIPDKHKQATDNQTPVIRLLSGKNIIRPQTMFKDKIDNSNGHPWIPRIKEKPNSLKPLAICLEETERGEEYSHPYELELEKFQVPEEFLKLEEPVYPKSLEDVEFKEISTFEELNKLVEILREYKVISVDLEHHSYRTYMGITCLMQISTVDGDYIIDTLSLRDKLYVLNEIFTKPSILKVFHGAEHDILWLQRDLSLYVVNMFDTFHAAKLLEFNSLSLAHLMQKYCKRSPNKRFQLADWRIRPLPQELKDYAREDTHYLIYLYQVLKRELLNKANGQENLLRAAFQRSTDVCKTRYLKPIWTDQSHLNLYNRSKRLFDNRQMCALKELYQWRDNIARIEDESTSYVLPNHMLLQISTTLPREMQGILACCNPVPPLVKANLLELHHIVLRARDKPVEKLILQEDARSMGNIKDSLKLNLENPLHCPHDLTYSQELPDNLPTLIGENGKLNKQIINNDTLLENSDCIYSIFKKESNNKTVKKIATKVKCLSPYQRYQLVKPFIKFEEEKKAEKDESQNKAKDSEDVLLKSENGENKNISVSVQEPIVIEDNSGIEQVNVNLQNITDTNKTDEERINSIRDHFLLLSKKTKEDEIEAAAKEMALYEEKSLVEMGGVKKRKRGSSEEPEITEEKDFGQKYSETKPLPFYGGFRNNKKKKRKAEDQNNEERPAKIAMTKSQKRSKKKNFAKKQNNQQSHNKVGTKHDLSKKGSNSDAKRRKIDKPHFQRNNSNSNFTPYDYAGVDFRQFQGGAGEASTGQNFTTKFKAKGKSKGKFNNKSGSFQAGRRSK